MGIRDKWQQKTGKQKRNTVLIGVLSVLIVMVIAAIIDDSIRGTKTGRARTNVTQIITPNQRNLTLESLANELFALRQQIQQQQLNQAGAGNSGLTAEEVRQIIQEYEAEKGYGTGIPPQFDGLGLTSDNISTIPQTQHLPSDDSFAPKEEESHTLYQSYTGNLPPTSDSAGTAANSGSQQRGRDTRTYLPAGTQLSVIAISGINAPTGEASGGSPENAMPILLRVKGIANMANGFKTDLSDCIIIANAYGQLADERAYVRTRSITCIRSDGAAIEKTMKGTVIGEDGKPGWHGRLVSRDGKAISQMIKIGMLNTLGQAGVALAGSVNIGHSDDSGNHIHIGVGNNKNSGQIAVNSAAQGINDVFGRIAGIYEKYAQQSFPVVEIQPMRTGGILLQEGIILEYTKDKR